MQGQNKKYEPFGVLVLTKASVGHVNFDQCFVNVSTCLKVINRSFMHGEPFIDILAGATK